jgi:hypothetical protein
MASEKIVDDMTGECRESYCSLRVIMRHSGAGIPDVGHVGGCRNSGGNCPLKEVVVNSGIPARVLEQWKCIEKYKIEQSEMEGKDIGWEEAARRWADNGHSAVFREVFVGGEGHNDIYRKVMNYVPAF